MIAFPLRINLARPHVGAGRAAGLAVLVALATGAALLVLLHGWPVLWLFDSHGDFTVFYGAARAAVHGRNPYGVPLYRYFPALTLLLRPLSMFDQAQAYVVWLLFLSLVNLAALALLARHYGRRALWGALALSPSIILGIMVSQPLPLLILALAGAMVLLERGRDALAGACLAIAWLKPQIALPAVCLFVLLRPRVALGFIPASVILLAPPSLLAWIHVMSAFGVERETVQASLTGLWPAVLGPHHPGYLVLILVAVGVSAIVRRRGMDPSHTLAWLLLIWFIAAPYSHAYDTALLVVPLAVLGPLPAVVLLDCWLGTALTYYSLSTATLVAPLLLFAAPFRRSAHV